MERLCHLFQQGQRARKINRADVKADRSAGDAAVENGRDVVRLPNLFEQSATVSSVMEFLFCFRRCQHYLGFITILETQR